LHQEPGQTGVKARPESRGETGLWPSWPRDKKTGKATATAEAQLSLAAVGRGKN